MPAPHFSTGRTHGNIRGVPPKSGTSFHVSALTVLATMLAVALVGVGSFFGVARLTNSDPDPSGPAVASSTAAPEATQSAAPATAAPVTGLQLMLPAQAQPNPDSVVRAYFDAINSGINNGDFVAAWALGGKNISGMDYGSFVTSFAGTANDNVTINGVVGNKVSIQLDATQTDGSHRFFSGTYTVQDGTIVAADIRRS